MSRFGFIYNGKYFEADKGSGGGNGGSGNDAGDQGELKYEDWLQEQPDSVKKMLSGWEGGLKSALTNERDARSKLEKEVRALAGKAEKGSELEQQLNNLANQLSESDRRADFYEAAHAAGVTNLKLAFLVAMQEDLFDQRGRVNFETLKKDYPELFGSRNLAPGSAGSGTDQPPSSGKKSMNDFIRTSAGKIR